MSTDTVWVVDDDHSIRWVAEKALTRNDIDCRSFSSAEELIAALAKQAPEAIVSDVHMPGMSGMELLQAIHDSYPHIPVIITTAHSDLDSAVSAYEGGAFEYLPKPFDINELVAVTRRAINHRREQIANQLKAEQSSSEESTSGSDIIGEAPAMQELFRAIGRLSNSHLTVLINGESGTGKELVARALHRHSPRREQPFVAINMAAIPSDLIESELFGHEKGAFTGASQRRVGRFEQADGGTLFLDEIGDMPAEAQTRLLRVLADGKFYRVGGHSPVTVDVRIITATHQNLEQRVAEKRFREDLLHRLNVIRLNLPKLSERREDIIKLAHHFLQKTANELDVETKVLLPDSEQFLQQHPWPGNVRQLENCCRWLTVMAPGREIHLQDLPAELLQQENTNSSATHTTGDWQGALQNWFQQQLHRGKTNVLSTTQPEIERIAIEAALSYTGGRKEAAAKLLGWGRNTLTRKIKELDLR
ncbi:nitrogen regulation protein NR(I) [Porticoccus sp. W117]|uniref:nitrogen regulation protein NR(I) n=1 Tax=Porticoccus sp. W117 TaxID=3054777 RepID=UPI00259A8EC1|nr:nitrogen regulation protein NR(I) [Porticoccus sp. W117]MDM3871454.1 nitrogen regulation protein NR(I) [Porticoccus sp. W117]